MPNGSQGFQTDSQAAGMSQTTSIMYFTVSTLYTAIFTAELSLRVHCVGIRKFFLSWHSWQWHYLDLTVVLVALFETALDTFERLDIGRSSSFARSASQFRILRIIRATRIIRGIRMTWLIRFVRSLRILVHQIVSTARSLIWAVILLVIIIYLFAIMFTQRAVSYLVDVGEERSKVHSALLYYWSTVPRSIYTLFKVIIGGVSWAEVSTPLHDVGVMWVVLFIAYICFTQMAVLNVLTGAFCQNAIDSAQHDQDLMTQSILAQKKIYKEQICTIFNDLDLDESGAITIEEFRRHLQSESVQAVFDSIGLDASDMWTLFKLMDIDQDSVIELDEFVSGCLRLKGNARALDIAKLYYEQKAVAKRLSRFMNRTDDALDLVGSRLGSINRGPS